MTDTIEVRQEGQKVIVHCTLCDLHLCPFSQYPGGPWSAYHPGLGDLPRDAPSALRKLYSCKNAGRVVSGLGTREMLWWSKGHGLDANGFPKINTMPMWQFALLHPKMWWRSRTVKKKLEAK